METPKKRKVAKPSGRVAFIACRDAVRAKLERGETMMSVYEAHQVPLRMSYTQFTRYVNLYIRGKPPKRRGKRNAAAESLSPAGMGPQAGGTAPVPDGGKPSTPRGLGHRTLPTFEYDPMDAYRNK